MAIRKNKVEQTSYPKHQKKETKWAKGMKLKMENIIIIIVGNMGKIGYHVKMEKAKLLFKMQNPKKIGKFSNSKMKKF